MLKIGETLVEGDLFKEVNFSVGITDDDVVVEGEDDLMVGGKDGSGDIFQSLKI